MGGKELLLVTAPLLNTLCGERLPHVPVSCPQSCLVQRLCPSSAQLGLAELPFPQSCQRLCDFHP